MISEILKIESIQIVGRMEGWENAVKAAVDPLVRLGYAEERYGSEIIENTKRYGAYYILMPGVALIHGRPDQGALAIQLAVTLVREPVHFPGKADGVKLMIAIASTDTDSHIEMLMDIASILEDKSRVDSILRSNSEAELYRLFTEPVLKPEDLDK